MKVVHSNTVAYLWWVSFGCASAQSPWGMTWSDSTFGSDGPWHAVTVGIGSNNTQVSMYPGASWPSIVLLSTLCDNTTVSSYCYGDHAGLFNPSSSVTWDNKSIGLDPHHQWSDFQWGNANAVSYKSYAFRALDSIDVGGRSTAQSDFIAIEQGYQTYPGGKLCPLDLGLLSLGAPDINQTFARDPKPPVNGTFISSSLYENGVTPSYSYGMHIGSPTFKIPGSLYIGGYDKNRVIGDITTQPIDSGTLPIELLDIGLKVESGGSVWGAPKITGLMAKSNSSLSSGLNVAIDPTSPYIYLPRSTCDAITANLPVTFLPDLGLYTWNTENENYTKIITSPSCLTFTFVMNDINTKNITIKVPFALLNLTLSPPLANRDTPYFPLMPTDGSPALGRAFLQAAFYGVHWSQKYWFMSQAPGPNDNFIKNIVNIDPTATSITGTENSWEETWSSFWTALPSAVGTNNSEPNTSPSTIASASGSGLSTGAKAGIGIGCAIAAIAVIGLIYWCWHRRKQITKPVNTFAPQQDAGIAPLARRGFPPSEIAGGKRDTWHELEHNPSVTGYYGTESSGRVSTLPDPQISTRESDRLMTHTSGPHELGP